MPGCCVEGCRNRSEKGFRLFRIPTGAKNRRRQEWLKLIDKNTLSANAAICEVHFDESQYEQRRQDGKKLLRPNAIPNLLKKHKEKEMKEKRDKARKVEKAKYSNPIQDSESHDYTETINVEATHTGITHAEATNMEISRDTASNTISEKEQIKCLQRTLRKTLRMCSQLKRKLQRKDRNFEKVFTKDQINFIAKNTQRGTPWSIKTINKALKLYVACGQKGYEEMRRQNLPYPSIRTIQHHIQGLKCKPGILEEFLHILKLKVQTFNSEEKHAVLLLDEMSIKPGLQYDHSIASVVGRPTIKLSGGFDSSQQQATHALVFMLCGISSKWKQTIAYEFTANSFCSQEIVQIITAIIQKANDIGIKIKAVISDMGPQNRSWWRIMNITVGKHSKINNYTTHPCSNEEKLFIMPDSVHVYKNVACSLTAGNKFYLDDTLVRLYNLPHNEISMKPIREVHNLEKNDSLKLCPHLKENAINPSHFDKMNVSLSIALLNNNVAAAISYHIGNGRIENIHKTTAWFLTIMYKWFKIMTSRYIKLALSHIDENVYKDNIIFLKDFIKIIKGITVGDGKWKPFQSGLILCTQTALDLQAEYLEKENFKFLLLGRFTQDALENLFSIIRGRKSVPDAREFKYTLRLVCLSQFKANINRGNYSTVDSDHIIQYCKEIKNCDLKNTSSEVQSQQSIEDLWDTGIYESLLGNETDLSDVIQTALYHLTGALLYKIKKNFKVCDHCFNAVVTNCANDLNNNICSFSRLREYKENILTFPTMDIYNIIYKCELLFRKNETKLILNELKVIQFVQMFLQQYPANFIPSCHNIIYKLIKTFVIARIHFSLKKKTINEIKTVNSSRSVAMKAYVSKPKHNK